MKYFIYITRDEKESSMTTPIKVPIAKLSADEHYDLYKLATDVNEGKHGSLSDQERYDHNDAEHTLSERELKHVEKLLRDHFTFQYASEFRVADNNSAERAKITAKIEELVSEKMAILYSFADGAGSTLSSIGQSIKSFFMGIASIGF